MGVAHPNPCPQHPRTVLLDLQLFDVDYGQGEAGHYHHAVDRYRSLPGWITPERRAECHETANDGDAHKQHDEIPVDPVEKDKSLPNTRDELEELQQAAWDNAVEVKHHPNLFSSAVEEVVAFSRSCMIARREKVLPAEYAVVIEVCRAAQGEGEGTDAEYGPEEEVVALLEAKELVELPPEYRPKS